MEILNSLDDFVEFKASMLLKKRELNGEPIGNNLVFTNRGILEIPELYDRIEKLR